MRRILVIAVVVLVAAYAGAAGVYKLFPYYIVRDGLGLLHGVGTSPAPTPDPPRTAFNTGLVNFDLVLINRQAPVDGDGGAVTRVGDGLIVVRRHDGRVIYYDPQQDSLRPIGIVLPPTNWQALPPSSANGHPVWVGYHRYNDALVTTWDGAEHIIVSYSYYDPAGQCITSRFAEAPLPRGWAMTGEAETLPLVWRVLFETRPCLPFKDERMGYAGNQAGGRMVIDAAGDLLVTVGDYEFDGAFDAPAYPQDPDADYGKIFRIDLPSGEAALVSRGHRNPQGIDIDFEGRIWETEHSAMGGDELNLVLEGGDYGWPAVSLGVFYADPGDDRKAWPFNPRQGRHDGFNQPAFAWIPSIAPSGLRVVRDFNPRWDGDLLVTSLIDTALHRLRLAGDRVVYDERMEMGRRIRDLEVAFGRIYLLFDDGVVGYLEPHAMIDPVMRAPGTPRPQTALQRNGCLQCHANPAAPQLANIAGALVAAQPGIAYSDALKAAGGRWDRARLRRFLADPNAFAPGTAMEAPGVTAREIDAILSELGID
jgi:hypothetical protein